MAIEKFRFVSPGVQIEEIDESIITPVPPAIGPVVIGRTAKGPLMQPVQVSSVADLTTLFGSPSNGVVGATDVWRTEAATAPTFATYAAQAYLRNSGPVTVIRLGGTDVLNAGDSGTPGWSSNAAVGLFGVSGSAVKLVGVLYTESGKSIGTVSGSSFLTSGSVGSTTAIALTLSSSSGTSSLPVASLTSTSDNFIRNVLLTNPTKATEAAYGYFLGETYENSLAAFTASVYVAPLSGTFASFRVAQKSAESAMVVFDDGATTTELFKFTGLNSGASLSKQVKISIENVRASTNINVTKYGTFDVVVRPIFEGTSNTLPLERFAGVNLNPNSDRYILKAIGDLSRQWDATNNRYVENGNYPNNSAYIRVELATDDIPATALPNGFLFAEMPTALGTIGAFGTVTHPDVQLFTGSVSTTAAKLKRFGLQANAIENADLVDLLRIKPNWLTGVAYSTTLFSTKQIAVSGSTVSYSSTNPRTGTLLTSGAVLGFDLPVYSGFDGADIKEAEPFVNSDLLDSATEATSNAYRSIKQMLDLVANPENLDLNVLCVPNLKESSLSDYMVELSRTRGDCLALLDLDGDIEFGFESATGAVVKPTSTSTAISGLQARSLDNSYGAAYFPAVFVASENIFMPASVAALGAFGGTDGRSALWFAPAGFNRGGLTVANAGVGVSRTALTLTAADRDALYSANINPIATFPNEGVVIFGQKTLQATPSALDRVNVRRLLNFIKKEVSRAATRVLFEPNVERTWNSFKGVVEPFLLAIKNNYGLDDARVVLDETTTTADLVDRNIMYCKLFVKPTRAIEFIAIDFIVTNSGAAFTE